MHFTHIRRRVLKRKKPEYLDRITDGTGDDPLTVVVDSTGLSTTRKGSYIEAIRKLASRSGRGRRLPCSALYVYIYV